MWIVLIILVGLCLVLSMMDRPPAKAPVAGAEGTEVRARRIQSLPEETGTVGSCVRLCPTEKEEQETVIVFVSKSDLEARTLDTEIGQMTQSMIRVTNIEEARGRIRDCHPEDVFCDTDLEGRQSWRELLGGSNRTGQRSQTQLPFS